MGDLLCDHISKLITAMFVHGHSPDDLLTASITPLVKDKHGNYCDSTNYSGIAFTSYITKIYDIIIINKYHNHLDTSSLQITFKTNHSTMICNLITKKEIVTYYINRGSKVYSCFLDASKIFDRIHYDKLFSILIDIKMPSVIVRSLLDMYTRPKVCTTWQGSHSEYFGVSNGIRQGGIL